MVFRSFSGIEKSPTAYDSRNDTHSFQGRSISGYIIAIYYINTTILKHILSTNFYSNYSFLHQKACWICQILMIQQLHEYVQFTSSINSLLCAFIPDIDINKLPFLYYGKGCYVIQNVSFSC